MKKVAAVGATLALGATGALVPALGAHAATVTTPCTFPDFNTALTHYDANNTNWFDTCIPQYGRGKTEFTITSNVDFPAGFKNLNDPSVTVTSNFDPTAANAYYSTNPTHPIPFDSLALRDNVSTSKSRTYRFNDDGVMVRIASVTNIETSAIPAACTAGGGAFTYTNAYKVTYIPTVITFDQIVSGEHWTYTITAAPEPSYLAMTSAPSSGPTQAIDDSHAICWSDGMSTARAEGSNDTASFVNGAGFTILKWNIAHVNIGVASPFPYSSSSFPSLGTYSRTSATQAKPALANTGSDARAALAAGVGLLAAGLSVAFVTRRRRTR